MPSLRLSVNAEVADFLLPDLPYVRRQEFDEMVALAYDQASAAFANPPLSALTTIQALIIQPDRDITVRVAGATAGATVLAGGIYLLHGGTIDNTGNLGVSIAVTSGTATIRLIAFGT